MIEGQTTGMQRQKKRKTRAKNEIQKTTQKTKDEATRTSLKMNVRVGSVSCTIRSRRVILVYKNGDAMNDGRTDKCLRQVEHIRCHL